jgi:hypothetical protein
VFIPVGSFHRHGAFPKTPVLSRHAENQMFGRNPFRVSETETQTLTVHEILQGLTQPQYRRSLYPEAIGYWQRGLQRAQQYPSQTCFLSPASTLSENTQYVDWGTYRIAPQSTPLMTAGLFSCSALILQNPNNQTHLLMHPFPSTNLTEIQEILQTFMNPNKDALTNRPIQAAIKAIIVPGLLEDANWSAQRLEEAVQSASQRLGIPVQTEWACFNPEESLLGVYSHLEKIADIPASRYQSALFPLTADLQQKTLSAYEGAKTHMKQSF